MTHGPHARLKFLNFFVQISRSPISRIAAAVVLILGLTGCDKLGDEGSPTAPSGPPAAGSSITYTAVGASDAAGVGSSKVCAPFTQCTNGMGYVQVAERTLRSEGYTVTLTNLGIPTAVIGPGLMALGRSLNRTIVGNFIQDEMPFVTSGSTLVTIFAGGNDVLTISAALNSGLGANNPNAYIDDRVREFGADFAALLSGIRQRASPRIVILNLPNLGGLPYLANATLAQRQAAQRASVGITTTVINPLVGLDLAVVDLMCDPRSYLPSNYSGDGFHPDDEGYAYVAAEVVAAIKSRSYPAPRSSCSQMTMVP